jgi:hypothetical protein
MWSAMFYAIAVGAILAVAIAGVVFSVMMRPRKSITPLNPPPPAPTAASDNPGQKALESTIDVTKVTTGLATGALLFSVAFVNNAQGLSVGARFCLVLAWTLLGFSAAYGVLAHSALVGQMAGADYSLTSRGYMIPGISHLVTLAAAIGALTVALLFALGDAPSLGPFVVGSPSEAMARAADRVPDGWSIDKVETIEFTKGIDSALPGLGAWHVQLKLKNNGPERKGLLLGPHAAGGFLDVFVSPSGEVYVPQNSKKNAP